MKMNKKSETDQLFRTDSLYLASALVTAGYSISSLEGVFPNRATFVFFSDSKLPQIVKDFHEDRLNLSARKLLYAQKELKDRLYEQSRKI